MNSRFVRPAEDEVAEAVDHYQQVTPGLGERFLAEVQRAVTTIEKFPRTSPVIASDIRRKVLLEFPYSLFYRLTEKEIIILAVAHHRQRPLYWRRRRHAPDAG